MLFRSVSQSRYISQNWIPSVNGVNYTQNSASQTLYIRTGVDNTSTAAGHGTNASADSKDMFLNPRRSSTNLSYTKTNDAAYNSGANTANVGCYINTRTASNVKKMYKNAVAVVSETTASTGRPTAAPFTGAANDDGVATGFRADQVFMEAWGAGVSQAQVTKLNNIIEENADSKGVGVQ